MTNVTQYCQSQTKRQPEAGYKFTTHHQCHAERSRSMTQLNVKRQNFFPISGCTTLLHCLFMAMHLSTTEKDATILRGDNYHSKGNTVPLRRASIVV